MWHKIMDSHNNHGWLIAALLREMSGLEGKAMFKCVESSLFFSINAGDKEAWRPHVCGRKWPLRFWPMWKKNGCGKEVVFSWTSKVKEHIKFVALCGLTTAGSCHTQKKICNRCYETSLKKQAQVDMYV